jgi:hypothetical protein
MELKENGADVAVEGLDPETRRVVRALLAGLMMAGELANPAVSDSPENRVEAAVRCADALMAELDRPESHEAAR